jgi:bifunctional non-homologous end joining protein LigD
MTLNAHQHPRLFRPANQTIDWLNRDMRPRLFVVKLHDATRLHYDFRLEDAGVFKSWVVPKGPCLDATVSRLAKQVADHRINRFEGTIPAGMYGAGTVMLWDWGYWTTDQDVGEALRTGQLNFQLDGQKLKGNWTLTRWQPCSDLRQIKWGLRKALDIEARSLREFDFLTEQAKSVLTGRTLDEIERRMPPRIHVGLSRRRKQTPDPRQRILFLDDRRPWLVAPSGKKL